MTLACLSKAAFFLASNSSTEAASGVSVPPLTSETPRISVILATENGRFCWSLASILRVFGWHEDRSSLLRRLWSERNIELSSVAPSNSTRPAKDLDVGVSSSSSLLVSSRTAANAKCRTTVRNVSTLVDGIFMLWLRAVSAHLNE